MISIFYDLETTDLEKVGQILNFAFIAVDENFSQIASLTKKVKISRLQLPQAGAILANRTDVIKHQEVAEVNENQAVNDIQTFINKIINLANGVPVTLIGYNSSTFDLDFLRTVFIRNGKNPYFTSIIPKDLLLVVRTLMATNDQFRTLIFKQCAEGKPNLKLETLGKTFSLLEKAQEHESLADVLLTINLAKKLSELYGIDVRTFEPYQVKKLHKEAAGSIFVLQEPLSSHYAPDKYFRSYPACLLSANERYALWINLEKYQKLSSSGKDIKEAILWKKFADHLVFLSEEKSEASYQSIAAKALLDFKQVNLNNYFQETTCDIEQFIYRIPPSGIRVIEQSIKAGFTNADQTKDIKHITKRYWLENFSTEPSDEFINSLKNYALYRYGGKLLLRNEERKEEEESSSKKSLTHPTFKTMLNLVDSKLENANIEDKTLLVSLKEFYLNSEIYQYAKAQLEK